MNSSFMKCSWSTTISLKILVAQRNISGIMVVNPFHEHQRGLPGLMQGITGKSWQGGQHSGCWVFIPNPYFSEPERNQNILHWPHIHYNTMSLNQLKLGVFVWYTTYCWEGTACIFNEVFVSWLITLDWKYFENTDNKISRSEKIEFLEQKLKRAMWT